MTRTPIHRFTPMPAPTKRMNRTQLRRESPKHKARRRTWRKSYDLHLSTGDVQCRAKLTGCFGRAEVPHHIIKRQRGGGDDPSNILPVCHNCHGAIHADEAGAIILGLLRRRPAKGAT